MMKNIALVAGGYSGEYVISVQSAAVIEKNIDPALYTFTRSSSPGKHGITPLLMVLCMQWTRMISASASPERR